MRALRRAVQGLEPECRLAQDLGPVVEAIWQQLDAEPLRLAVAAENGRGTERIEALIEGLELKGIDAERMDLQRGQAPPWGFDAWLLVTSADQLGSLAEKELLERLGPTAKDGAIVLVMGMDKVPEDRRGDVLDFAQSVFTPRGVPRERIFAFAGSESAEGGGPLRGLLNGWLDRRGALRAAAISRALAEPRESASREADDLHHELMFLDDAEMLESQVAEMAASISLLSELLVASGPEVSARVIAGLDKRWRTWRHEAAGFTSTEAQQGFLAKRLKSWSEGHLLEALGQGVRQVFEHQLAEGSPLGPTFEASLAAALDEISEMAALTLPEVAVEPQPARPQPPLIRLVQIGAPAVGGLLGFIGWGLRGMVYGTPLGLAASELIQDRLLPDLPSRRRESAPPDVGADQVEPQITEASEKLLRVVEAHFVEAVDEERIRLKARLARAREKAKERQSKVERFRGLSELVRSIDALTRGHESETEKPGPESSDSDSGDKGQQ